MSKIAIVIPVRNRRQHTENILYQIYEQIYQKEYAKDFAVIVVDDGSTDGTKEAIETLFPDVYSIEGDGSLWWTGAIAEGMKYAIHKLNADYIIWLNDDIVLSNNFIKEIRLICHNKNYQNSLIGGIVRDKTYSEWLVFSGIFKKKPIRSLEYFAGKEEIEIDTLNGNITIIPRQVVNKIGLPDRSKFRHYGGDFDFVTRAKKAGFRILLSSRLQAITDWQIEDLIRYMPFWMQWNLAKGIFQKYMVLRGFTNLKCHYNIWHMINMIYGDYKHIPTWKYIIFYLKQILKVLSSSFWSKSKIEKEMQIYLKQENAPQAMIEAITYQITHR